MRVDQTWTGRAGNEQSGLDGPCVLSVVGVGGVVAGGGSVGVLGEEESDV